MKKTKKLNGLKCKKCKGELYDVKPNVYLLSNPPKKEVKCIRCNNVNYISVKVLNF